MKATAAGLLLTTTPLIVMISALFCNEVASEGQAAELVVGNVTSKASPAAVMVAEAAVTCEPVAPNLCATVAAAPTPATVSATDRSRSVLATVEVVNRVYGVAPVPSALARIRVTALTVSLASSYTSSYLETLLVLLLFYLCLVSRKAYAYFYRTN